MNKNYKSLEELSKGTYKRIFFYRICGTGMGAAATLLKEAGHEVAGADAKFYPPMGPYLKSTGITCHNLNEVTPELLRAHDLIVVGNVVPKNSEDAKIIEASGVDYCSFPAALGGLVLASRNVVGIAGTHGKTTTTYLACQLFEKLGFRPGYFIGGVLEGRPSSVLGEDYFFIESDEYDSAYFEKFSKFRSYELDHMILTSLEFDHADIFKNEAEILQQFASVMSRLKGQVLAASGYQMIDQLQHEFASLNWERYEAQVVNATSTGTKFRVNHEGENYEFETSLVGEHNIANLTAVILFALKEGVPSDKIQAACLDLKMVKRRQEVRAKIGGCILIDDFAHHPRAIKLTIDAIKTRYPGRRVVALFEPNSATARSNIFQREFTEALLIADEVYLTTLARSTSVVGASDLDIEMITRDVQRAGKASQVLHHLDEIRSLIKRLSQEETVLLVLSNGTCLGLWESDLVS